METILEQLLSKSNRTSTWNSYITVWRNCNKFFIKLDNKPNKWEDRVALYCAFLVQKGLKLTTLRSYVVNDVVCTHLPVSVKLLELMLFELNRIFSQQPYLRLLYQMFFSIAYYGLFRIGELAYSQHLVKACDVHVAKNKNKILMVLYSSKTHGIESRPKKIKIQERESKTVLKSNCFFCPFRLMRDYYLII